MIETRPRRAAVYARISQDRDGTMLGVDRQREDCMRLIRSRGWELAGVYVDNDVSAYSGRQRQEYERLLGDVRGGAVDAIVAWHPDRLHRSPRELEGFIDLVEARGTAVETVSAGPVDLTTPSGRATARTLGAWARYESEHRGERLARKHRERAEAGRPVVSGSRPFGLSADWSTIVMAEAAAIREAVGRISAGDSIRGICTDWNRRGITTTTGGRWQPFPLRRVLTNGYIAGLREHFGVEKREDRKGTVRSLRRREAVGVVRGTWPAIIEAADLERVRAILRDPGRRTVAGNGNARSYLLSGFMVCRACGKRMVSRPRADHTRRYICAKGPMYEGCGTAILADQLEQLVSEAVLQAIDSPALAAAVTEFEAGNNDSNVMAQVQADTRALEGLAKDHYVDRIITREEFLAARKALETRVAAGKRRMASSTGTSALSAIAGDPRGRWARLGFDQRRAVIGAVVERVTIGPGRRGYNRFDESRVEVNWLA